MKLAANIKSLRKLHKISQTELAQLLQVSQTSVAHYEKGSRQPSIETLILLSSIFNISIDALVGNEVDHKHLIKKDDSIAITDELWAILDKRNEAEFFGRLTQLATFYKVEHIIDRVLKKLLYQVGDDWEKGILSEADEHYITNIVRAGIHLIRLNALRNKTGKKAIALAVHTEQHTLGIEMVSTILKEAGIETLYLGSNVPMKSLKKMLIDYKPDFLLLSITLNEHINGLEMMLDSLKVLNGHKPLIVIGGQAGPYAKSNLAKEPNIVFVDKLEELLDLVLDCGCVNP